MENFRTYIGIDNGVSGSIGVIQVSETQKIVEFLPTPVFKEQSYTKSKEMISRIHFRKLKRY